jgi:phage gpG-like protein
MAALRGPRLRLYIDGEKAVAEDLRAIGQRARDAKPVMRVIQQLMARGAREQFETQGARSGEPWKTDTPAWIERKRRAGHSTDTEQETGATMASLISAGRTKGAVRRLSKTSTTFGTRTFASQWQGHRRRLLGITMKDADRWAELMVDWILSGKDGNS